MKKIMMLAVCGLAMVVWFGCGQTVKRVDDTTVTDYSGRWNDTDSRLVAEKMINEVLARPWLSNFMMAKGRKPVVIIGTLLNKSSEHISMDVFTKEMERSLTNADKVTFVASKDERAEVRDERTDQQEYSSEETAKKFKKELGADYMLKGVISSVTDEKEGTKAIYYQVDLELVNLETNAKSWYGQEKIKKIISKSSFGF